jgi:hypothetical protein
LREICTRKKRNPKSGANIGAITGILLIVEWELLAVFAASLGGNQVAAWGIGKFNLFYSIVLYYS